MDLRIIFLNLEAKSMKKIYSILALLSATMALKAQPTQPAAPADCNSSNCTPPLSENCASGSTVITSFTGATLRAGSANSVGAVYSFYNVTTVSGQQINATVTIDATSNVSMTGANFSIDDDAATDQAGNSIAGFFAPRITPDQNLTTTDRRGYVQFTIRFFLENGTAGQQYPDDFITPPPFGGLSGLNYIHYDIDGTDVGTGGWFRETGLIRDMPGSEINANLPTELISYNYADGGNWKGFAGSVCERTGVSRCAEVAAAANYATPQTQITVRMGYDYNYNGTEFDSQPTRQYGSRFGCFEFPQQSTLPVRLLNFSGSLLNQKVKLSWTSEKEINFSAYEVERSENGKEYTQIGIVFSGGGTDSRMNYEFPDDLSAQTGKAFFYRLKMMDVDGTFSYSSVVMIRRDGKALTGVSINPNPVSAAGSAVIRMEFTAKSRVEVRVLDMTGKVVLSQQNNVNQGNNAIAINNIGRLVPGVYWVQVIDRSDISTGKFSIVR
jgi:hypothetical protein